MCLVSCILYLDNNQHFKNTSNQSDNSQFLFFFSCDAAFDRYCWTIINHHFIRNLKWEILWESNSGSKYEIYRRLYHSVLFPCVSRTFSVRYHFSSFFLIVREESRLKRNVNASLNVIPYPL